MVVRVFNKKYNDLVTIDNLLTAWQAFLCGKRKKADVVFFGVRLMDNILQLHRDLSMKNYLPGGYTMFRLNDPKPREIHKASVRDRLVHHFIYQELYGFFDSKFIYDSYSCRVGKGTHKALNRFCDFSRKVSKNNTKQCWVLKCDIKKFFASIDHDVLKSILAKHITDTDLLALLENIIDSFPKGLPLGNLTSQLLVNVYMNEFDQFIKHTLKQKYYIRYADDFVFMGEKKENLEMVLLKVEQFLEEKLRLSLHPDKVFIKTLSFGVDFLGWVHFPRHRVLRTATKWRMFRNLEQELTEGKLASYVGILSHGNGHKLSQQIGNKIQILPK